MEQLPKALIEAAENGTLLPIVGAGVSMSVRDKAGNAVFPSWKVLLERAADELDLQQQQDDAELVRIFLRKFSYQKAADSAYNGLKGTPWFDFFKQQFDPDTSTLDEKTAELPRTIWQLSNQIITLNYDKILSWSNGYNNVEFDNASKSELADFQRGNYHKPMLWHLHGRVDNSANIVLTTESYKSFYPTDDTVKTNYQAALKTLQNLTATRTLLFIGCGMDDTELLAEIEYQQQLFADNTGPHFGLVHKDQLVAIQAKVNTQSLKFITFEDFGQPLVDLVNQIAKHAQPKVAEYEGEDDIEDIVEDEPTTKIAILTANPINDEQDYSKWLEHFNKLDAVMDHYCLSVDNLNGLDGYHYIFILSQLIQDKILIEDEYLVADQIDFTGLEDEIGVDALYGVVYLLDKLPENELIVEYPTLVTAPETTNDCKKVIFELFNKNRVDKIPQSRGYNLDEFILAKCFSNKAGKTICWNTTPLPTLIAPNNLQGLVGRQNDLENISRKLLKLINKVGVLTIKGAGGIGKTTLTKKVVYELARRGYFNQKIHFIDCEAIADTADFSYQLAIAFGRQQDESFDIRKIKHDDKRNRLIIADNLETILHLKDKDACLALLQQAANLVTVIITTRELSGLEAEECYELRPLTTDEAFEYFIQQAGLKQLSPQQNTLVRDDIVKGLLDNNPLAIKLVAVNIPKGKTLLALKEELEQDIFNKASDSEIAAFDQQSDSNIDRKRSIFGSVEYSYKNLTDAQQQTLLLLSAFPDGMEIEGLKGIQQFAEKDKQVIDSIVTDKTIKALQDKSLVETHGPMVILQSIVRKFAEHKLEQHPQKTELMQHAFIWQQFLVIILDKMMADMRPVALTIADSMLSTLAKSIELSLAVKPKSATAIEHIGLVFRLMSTIGELPLLKRQLQKSVYGLTDEYLQLLQLWLASIDMSVNSVVELSEVKESFEKQIALFSTIDGNFKTGMGSFLLVLSIECYLFEAIDENYVSMKTLENHELEVFINSALFFGCFDANATQQLSVTSSSIYEMQSQFNLVSSTTLKLIGKDIKVLHDKDNRKLELSYIRAKIKSLPKRQINQLRPVTCRHFGLQALMYAFNEKKPDSKEVYFKQAIHNLRASPYRYTEAHLFYAEFLQQQDREDLELIANTGLEVAKKYHFRYLQYKLEILLGITDKLEYSPKDYPLPNGIDFEPIVERYLKHHGKDTKQVARQSKPKKRIKKG